MASFTIQEIPDAKAPDGVHYRITDKDDNRVATCYVRSNALMVCGALNREPPVIPGLPQTTPTDDAVKDIIKERHRQSQLVKEGKFLWNCAIMTVSYDRKLSVLAEEYGEVAKEVVEHGITSDKYEVEHKRMPPHRERYFRDRIRKELIQVAAVCVAWIESLDQAAEE